MQKGDNPRGSLIMTIACRLYCDSDAKATIPDSARKEGGHLYMSGSSVTSSIDGDTSEGTSDEEEDSETADTKQRILEAALKHVVSIVAKTLYAQDLMRLCSQFWSWKGSSSFLLSL